MKILLLLIVSVLVTVPSIRASDSTPEGVTVRIRLVYAKDGKPAKHQLVILDLGDPQHMPAQEWRDQTRSPGQTTDSDGVTTFRLSGSLPHVVYVEFENGRVEGCAREDLIPLQEVLRQGVTVGADKEFGEACRANPAIIKRFTAKPGEIVIFVRKLSWWDNP